MPFHHTWEALAPTELLLLHIRNPELRMNRGSFPCPASPFYFMSPHSPHHHHCRRPQLGNGNGNHLKLSYYTKDYYHINKGETLSVSLFGADSTTFSCGCFARFSPKQISAHVPKLVRVKAYTVSPNPENVFFSFSTITKPKKLIHWAGQPIATQFPDCRKFSNAAKPNTNIKKPPEPKLHPQALQIHGTQHRGSSRLLLLSLWCRLAERRKECEIWEEKWDARCLVSVMRCAAGGEDFLRSGRQAGVGGESRAKRR